MAPAEVILSSFTGTVYPGERRTILNGISFFSIFFSAYVKVGSFLFIEPEARLSDIFGAHPSFLQLQIISPAKIVGKGGRSHA